MLFLTLFFNPGCWGAKGTAQKGRRALGWGFRGQAGCGPGRGRSGAAVPPGEAGGPELGAVHRVTLGLEPRPV